MPPSPPWLRTTFSRNKLNCGGGKPGGEEKNRNSSFATHEEGVRAARGGLPTGEGGLTFSREQVSKKGIQKEKSEGLSKKSSKRSYRRWIFIPLNP